VEIPVTELSVIHARDESTVRFACSDCSTTTAVGVGPEIAAALRAGGAGIALEVLPKPARSAAVPETRRPVSQED